MKKALATLALAMVVVASPAAAWVRARVEYMVRRGVCEAESATLSHDDQQSLLDRFPELFSSPGEVSSFLARAFTCDLESDGQWYITDHRQEVLESEWFQRRLP